MIDCVTCEDPIGDLDNPIFVLSDNATIVCKNCYYEAEGDYPDPRTAQFDKDEVSDIIADQYFRDLE